MRVVCLAFGLVGIVFASGCIPVGNSGHGSGAKVGKEGADVAQREATPQEGSEELARKHFAGEMAKWMAGQSTGESRTIIPIEFLQNRPLKYEVLSVIPHVPTENSFLFNVSITFSSQTGSPLEKVITYIVIWNPETKIWFAMEKRT